jgi:hypothetical protein
MPPAPAVGDLCPALGLAMARLLNLKELAGFQGTTLPDPQQFSLQIRWGRPGEADGGGHGVQVGADPGDLDHRSGGLGAEHAEAVGGGRRPGRAGRGDQALAGRAVVAVEHADP